MQKPKQPLELCFSFWEGEEDVKTEKNVKKGMGEDNESKPT